MLGERAASGFAAAHVQDPAVLGGPALSEADGGPFCVPSSPASHAAAATLRPGPTRTEAPDIVSPTLGCLFARGTH